MLPTDQKPTYITATSSDLNFAPDDITVKLTNQISQTRLNDSIDQQLLNSVELVSSGTVVSGHSVFSGQLSKSRNCLPLTTVIFTSIKRSRSPFT